MNRIDLAENLLHNCFFCGGKVHDPNFKAHIDCAVNFIVDNQPKNE